MPITVTQEREGRVFLWTYPDNFTASQITELIEDFQKNILDKATEKIFVISDFTDVRHLPPNIMSVALKMIKKTHPMMGPVIEVTPNGFVNALAAAFAKLNPSGSVIVRKTLDEAFEEVDRLIAEEAHHSIRE